MKAQPVAALLALCVALGACKPPSAAGSRAQPGTSPLEQALAGRAPEGFERADGVRALSFPADHGPHPGFRTEWWYFTGVLHAGERRFGFELTFFRVALQAQEIAQGWRSNQVYIAHFALTDPAARRFHAFERVSRPAAGLAGARADPFAVWLEDWEVASDETGAWRLRAREGSIGVALTLEPTLPPVPNGAGGLSRKGAAGAGRASYYYSLPRQNARGVVELGEARHDVEGLVWLDREWATRPLADDQLGWDWFALHLGDGSNLMFYQLRDRAGSVHPYSSGTWSYPDGRVEHLSQEQLVSTPLRYWTAPDGSRYPIDWRLEIPHRGLDVVTRALLDDQWIDLGLPSYWEGAVEVRGTQAGVPIEGDGYLELTGYGPGLGDAALSMGQGAPAADTLGGE